MGWGDEIMAIGHAVVTQERDERRRPVRILSLGGLPRWSPVWESQASILRPEDPDPPGGFQAVQNGAGCRPYIKYPFTRESGLTPSGWRARDHWGRLELREERERPQPRLDRNAGGGMSVVVGPPSLCEALGTRFRVLVHNTLRGAAGAALLNGELLRSTGRLRSLS